MDFHDLRAGRDVHFKTLSATVHNLESCLDLEIARRVKSRQKSGVRCQQLVPSVSKLVGDSAERWTPYCRTSAATRVECSWCSMTTALGALGAQMHVKNP